MTHLAYQRASAEEGESSNVCDSFDGQIRMFFGLEFVKKKDKCVLLNMIDDRMLSLCSVSTIALRRAWHLVVTKCSASEFCDSE